MCNFVWTKLGIKTKQNVHSNDKTEVIWQSRAWSTFCVNQGSFINYFEKSVGLKVHHMRREYSDWNCYWKCVCRDFVFPGFKEPTLIYLEGEREKKWRGGERELAVAYYIPKLNASFLDNCSRLIVPFLSPLIFKSFPYFPLGKHPALRAMGSLYTFIEDEADDDIRPFSTKSSEDKAQIGRAEFQARSRAGTSTGVPLTFERQRSS